MKGKEQKKPDHVPPKVPTIHLDSLAGKDDQHPSDKSRLTVLSQQSHRASNVESAVGFLSKRMSRRFGRRMSERKDSAHGMPHQAQPVPKMEPTYQLEPKGTFSSCAVEKLVKRVLHDNLDTIKYDAHSCGNLTRTLVDDIKERVKSLKYERYKIVCTVTLGENKGQGVMTTSRCAWEPKFDSYASYTLTNKNIFCTACVFGVYVD
ncbi:dynein light chain Tctex-type 5-like [Haliotis cracherodii]|uniref:dynein light chain Tctex-type 5-like n=1 Tax=Haliotis cracherodii TaxID=6455 RepID=UPI0039E8B542